MKPAWLLALLVAAGCGPANELPPEPPPKASPSARIFQVGKVWREGGQAEGYLNEADVAYIRTRDEMTLRLTEGASTALVELQREELFRTPQGREYHCSVAGSVQAGVRYSWRVDEPAVNVRTPASTHRRVCKEPGFAKLSKQFDALNATYVLRGDQLIAVDPPMLRSSMLPAD